MIGSVIVVLHDDLEEDAASVTSSESEDLSLAGLINNEDWDEVRTALVLAPETAADYQTIRLYGKKTSAHTLHQLCRKKRVPLDVLDAMICVNPAALRTPDSQSDSLPIHVACRSGLPAKLIEKLIEEYPESQNVADADGNLPIHLACSFGCMEVIALLARRGKEQNESLVTNKKKQTPLHLACSRYDVSREVVRQLLGQSKGAAEVADWQGQLPLHKAVMWRVEPDIIELLLDAHPDSVRVEDKHGLTPYGVCRKRAGQKTNTSTVQLLRKYQKNNGKSLNRLCDTFAIRFDSVDSRKRSRPPLKRARAAS